jgi:TPR repeat protein
VSQVIAVLSGHAGLETSPEGSEVTEREELLDTSSLRRRAEAGSTVAQCVLGIKLLHGYDCQTDTAEAFKWLSAAHAKGAARATAHLGLMHEGGLHTPEDPHKAGELYLRAAQAGEALACLWLARLLRSERLGSACAKDAARWYREFIAKAAVDDEDADIKEAEEYLARHGGEKPL